MTEQVLVHPGGLRARLIKYETDAPGGVLNLQRSAAGSCRNAGKAEFYAGRVLWVYRGLAGGTDLGCTGVAVPEVAVAEAGPDLSCTGGHRPYAEAQVMHVVEISSGSAERPPSRTDAAAVLAAWASST